MSRKAWFGYTATSHEGKPSPCIWYDDLPVAKNYLNPTIVGTPVDVSQYVGPKGEVTASFNQLVTIFPPPVYEPVPKLMLDQFNKSKETVKPMVIQTLMSENILAKELAQ